MPRLTVKAFLVTYDYGLRDTVGNLNHFADSLCANFDNLQEHGHPKWKQVKLELPTLVRGWKYYQAGREASARVHREPQREPRRGHQRGCGAGRAQAAFALYGAGTHASAMQVVRG